MGNEIALNPDYIQLGYVTNDFERALKQFEETHGIHAFVEMRDAQVETGPGKIAHCNIALARVGKNEVEIINPIGGDDEVYAETLPKEKFAVNFHHVCRMHQTQESFSAAREKERQAGIELALEGQDKDSGTQYYYADYREKLGHYIENIYYPPAAREFLDKIPTF